MNIIFEVHGVLSMGHTIWHKKSDYAKKFYSSDEIRGGGNLAFFIEISRDLVGYKTYYTYIINNVLASSNRSGSYFGITISTDAFYTDIKLVYTALDSIFNKMVLGKILTKLSTGGFKYICDTDFSEVESVLQKMEQTFHRVIEVASAPSDVLNIPESFNKTNKRLTIDATNFSNSIVNEQVLNGYTVVAIPNLNATSIQDLEKKLSQANSQLSNCSQQLVAANNKCSTLEEDCKTLKQKVATLDAKLKNAPPVKSSIKDLEKLVDDAKIIINDFNKFVNSKIPKAQQTAPPNPEETDWLTSIFRKFRPKILLALLTLLTVTCILLVINVVSCQVNTMAQGISTDSIIQSDSNVNATTQPIPPQLDLESNWKIDIPELTNGKTIVAGKNFSFDLVDNEYDGKDLSTRKVHPDSASIRWAIVENDKVHHIENNSFEAPKKGVLTIISILNNKIIAMRAIGIGSNSSLAITEGYEPYPYYIAEYSDLVGESGDCFDMDGKVYNGDYYEYYGHENYDNYEEE